MLVVIPCGARKQPSRAQACELYTGPYFRACLAYARTLASDDHILILSGKYGLIGLHDVIDTYEQRINAPGSIPLSAIARQIIARGVQSEAVVAIGGRAYTNICRTLWRSVTTPLAGRGGMGQQLAWLTQQTRGAA